MLNAHFVTQWLKLIPLLNALWSIYIVVGGARNPVSVPPDGMPFFTLKKNYLLTNFPGHDII